MKKQNNRILVCIKEGSYECPCGLESVCGTNADQDELQMKDETNKPWVNAWKKACVPHNIKP